MRQGSPGVTVPLARPIAALLFLLLLSGCAIKLVSGYDEETDRSVMALQRRVETFLLRLEEAEGSSECAYDHHKSFYGEAKVEVSAIQVRAAATSGTKTAPEQVGLLSKHLEGLEQLHKIKSKKGMGKNCLSKEEIESIRHNFNTAFISILRGELAKRRGA